MTSLRTSLKYHALRLRWALADNQVSLVVFAALLLAGGILSLGRALDARSAPSVVIVNATATPALALLPTPAPSGPTLPRATVAYAAPGGVVLGGLEPGRAFTVLARYGSAWLQLDAGSGPVWVAAADAGLVVDAALADLEPTLPPAVVYVPQVRQEVVYVPAPAPAPAPAPQPAAEPAPDAKPATGIVSVVSTGAGEAAHRAAGGVFTVASVSEPRQAGPCVDRPGSDGRACLGSKP